MSQFFFNKVRNCACTQFLKWLLTSHNTVRPDYLCSNVSVTTLLMWLGTSTRSLGLWILFVGIWQEAVATDRLDIVHCLRLKYRNISEAVSASVRPWRVWDQPFLRDISISPFTLKTKEDPASGMMDSVQHWSYDCGHIPSSDFFEG